MKYLSALALLASGSVAAITFPVITYAQATYTGIVEQVWEDGFRLNIGDRSLTVDAWDLYGDRTPQQIAVGDRLVVTGEFGSGDFDAFSIEAQPADR